MNARVHAIHAGTTPPTMDIEEPLKKYEYHVSAGDNSHAARLVDMVGRGKRVLEIGCASGSQTRALVEDMDCSVVGVEIDPDAAERARPYCSQLIVGNLEAIDLVRVIGADKFDVVMFADVLEHLRDPGAALKKCRDLLNEDGCIVASIPNIAHAAITFELAHGRFNYKDKGLLDDTHIRFFTRESVLELFGSAGFLVEIIDRTLLDPSETEFETKPQTADERTLIRYFLDHNPEAKTYQFLIRAVRMDSDTQIRNAAVQMRAQIDELEQQLHLKTRELNRVQSELDWLHRNPLRALIASLRRALPKK